MSSASSIIESRTSRHIHLNCVTLSTGNLRRHQGRRKAIDPEDVGKNSGRPRSATMDSVPTQHPNRHPASIERTHILPSGLAYHAITNESMAVLQVDCG
jgi:hypothetical protein